MLQFLSIFLGMRLISVSVWNENTPTKIIRFSFSNNIDEKKSINNSQSAGFTDEHFLTKLYQLEA